MKCECQASERHIRPDGTERCCAATSSEAVQRLILIPRLDFYHLYGKGSYGCSYQG